MIRLLHAEKALMKDDELNEFEKLYVSEFVREGYISMKEEKPISNIPVFTVEQMEQLDKIVNEIKESLGVDFLKEYLDGYSEMMDKLIPKFLDKNVRNYHKYAIRGGFDMFAHMIMEAKNGGKCKLELPDAEGAKHAMTWLVVK